MMIAHNSKSKRIMNEETMLTDSLKLRGKINIVLGTNFAGHVVSA